MLHNVVLCWTTRKIFKRVEALLTGCRTIYLFGRHALGISTGKIAYILQHLLVSQNVGYLINDKKIHLTMLFQIRPTIILFQKYDAGVAK